MRRRARAARKNLPDADRQVVDGAINDRAIELVGVAGAKRVSSYLATDGEPDLSALHLWCEQIGVAVAVPMMLGGTQLEFRLMAGADLTTNSSGISEPRTGRVVTLASLDIVFAPLVIFDEACNRAGRGGGWYDRALEHRHAKQMLVGVAYECQRVEAVPTHSHDVALDRVITEAQTYIS